MKNLLIYALIGSLAFPGSQAWAQSAQPFSDVPQGHWAGSAILELKQKNILFGLPDGRFGGNLLMDRGQAAIAAWRVLAASGQDPSAHPPDLTTQCLLSVFSPSESSAQQASGTEFGFRDVPQDIFEVSLNNLLRAGIVRGYPDASYQSRQPLRRTELAMIVARLVLRLERRPKLRLEKAEFADVSGREWWFGAQLIATGTGVMTGYADHTFRGDQPVTRNEFAVTLARLMRLTQPSQPGQGEQKQDRQPISRGSHIYIADYDSGRVFQLNGFSTTNWTAYGRQGVRDEEGNDIFIETSGIGVDNQERIYLADYGNQRIVRVDDMRGRNWVSFRLKMLPAAIYVTASGRIYILLQLIYAGDKFHILRMDDMTGRGLVDLSLSLGSGEMQLASPQALFVDAQERIYVADTTNHRIVRMDNMQGNGWVTLGTFGTGPLQFRWPVGLFVSMQGQIYVADLEAKRIVRFDDMAGKGWIVFSGTRNHQLSAPRALWIGMDNRIYFVEGLDNTIKRMDDMSGHHLSVLTLPTGLTSPNAIIVR
ncbi:MAG TPA: S-layer homology domain-containing protein [Chthonomonadaceae bacterium]|nr:S-layer homology domain-containing protein [Chthonomonadaceae bacterium]